MVAAAFVVYGLPTILIVATPEGADGFAFDPAERTWRLALPSIRVPEAQYTSINWTYRDRWSDHVAAGVSSASDGLRGRYSGSMVEDVLRVLLAGGVTVASLAQMIQRGTINPDESVVAIISGHGLKTLDAVLDIATVTATISPSLESAEAVLSKYQLVDAAR